MYVEIALSLLLLCAIPTNSTLTGPVVFGEEQKMDLCRQKWWRENYDYCRDILAQLPEWYRSVEEYLLNYVFNYNRKHPLVAVSYERMREVAKLNLEAAGSPHLAAGMYDDYTE